MMCSTFMECMADPDFQVGMVAMTALVAPAVIVAVAVVHMLYLICTKGM